MALVAALLCCCTKKESDSKSLKPVSVRTVVVEQTTDAGTRTFLGEVEAVAGISLHHPLGGKLVALHVHNGHKVSQGQAVADLDDTQSRSMHEAALATLNQAEDGYQRLLQVHDNGGLSDAKWIEMQTNLEKARQQEIATRKSVEDCHLTAPIDGIVTEADVHVGQQLFPGQTICTVLSLNALQTVFTVPENDVSSFAIGDTVTLTLNALPDKTFRGIVTEKGLSAGMIAHTYRLKASILSPTKQILPGMITKVQTIKSFASGLVVPAGCVQTTPEGPAVWIVRDGIAQRQQITTTQFVRDGVLVSKGLSVGDRVVVAGYQKLFNGAKVTEQE